MIIGGKNLEQIIPIKEGLYVETHKYANICTVNNGMQRVKLVFLTIFCCLQQSMTRLDWCWHRSIIGKVYFSNTSCSFIFVNLDNQRFFFFFKSRGIFYNIKKMQLSTNYISRYFFKRLRNRVQSLCAGIAVATRLVRHANFKFFPRIRLYSKILQSNRIENSFVVQTNGFGCTLANRIFPSFSNHYY